MIFYQQSHLDFRCINFAFPIRLELHRIYNKEFGKSYIHILRGMATIFQFTIVITLVKDTYKCTYEFYTIIKDPHHQVVHNLLSTVTTIGATLRKVFDQVVILFITIFKTLTTLGSTK